MMKRSLRSAALLTALVLAALFAACSGVPKEVFELSASSLELAEGESGEIKVLKSSSPVSWTCGDGSVCEISVLSDGVKVTAKSVGTAVITAKNKNAHKTVQVTVKKPVRDIRFAVDKAVIDMDEGENFLDLGVTLKNVGWSEVSLYSDNYAVAVVNDRGIVTAKSAGKATVFAETDGASASAEITVLCSESQQTDFPLHVNGGMWPTGHVQGIAVDAAQGYIYYTFTTIFVKTDFEGNIVGSFSGYQGHLGDCAYNERDGKVYSSLTCTRGDYGWTNDTAIYAAVIDVDKITKTGMDAYKDDIMTAVCLTDAMEDYYTDLNGDGYVSSSLSSSDRRYGVTGTDGICFGPKFGERGGKEYLTVAYAVAKNENRTDNDYLVFLQYDVSDWRNFGKKLDMSAPHTYGPRADGKYFLYTGNTDYGVQTMDYDKENDFWVCVTYNYAKDPEGKKAQFYKAGPTTDPTFLIDNSVKPVESALKGQAEEERGMLLSFVKKGNYNPNCGVYSWAFWIGNTGLAYLGNNMYYVAEHSYVTVGGERFATADVRLYRYTGSTEKDAKGNDLFAAVTAKS